MPRSFGFEAEFTGEVGALIRELTSAGLAHQGERLHGYHCDCEPCTDLWNYKFRAQRDSSCGGEIISGLFFDTEEGWEVATNAMQVLQEAALEVDAGMSMNCGMHVHLGWAPMQRFAPANMPGDWAQPERLTMAWLGLEPLLWEYVAGSVWAAPRGSNERVSAMILGLMHADYSLWEGRRVRLEGELEPMGRTFMDAWKERFLFYARNMSWDRHADLARAGHGGSYEVRIFNASRTAWRTEMACRLSVALSKADVVEQFAEPFEEWLWSGALAARDSKLHLMSRSGRIPNVNRTDPSDPRRMISPDWPITLDQMKAIFRESDPRLGDLLDKQVAYQVARKEVPLPHPSILAVRNEIIVPGHDQVLARLNVAASA